MELLKHRLDIRLKVAEVICEVEKLVQTFDGSAFKDEFYLKVVEFRDYLLTTYLGKK